MRKELTEECPVCGARLRGSRFTGYQCGKCGAYFSARAIARNRRQRFTELISKHFPSSPASNAPSGQSIHHSVEHSNSGAHKAVVERIDIIIEDKAGKIERALAEAKEAARVASRHLEDVLIHAEKLPDPVAVEQAIRVEKDTRAEKENRPSPAQSLGFNRKSENKESGKQSKQIRKRINKQTDKQAKKKATPRKHPKYSIKKAKTRPAKRRKPVRAIRAKRSVRSRKR